MAVVSNGTLSDTRAAAAIASNAAGDMKKRPL